MPPGREQKVLPEGQAGAIGRRADAFDASVQLVEDELIVKFKPRVSKEKRGKALGRAKAEERRMLWAADAEDASDGDLVLAKVTDNKSRRVGLKAAAADIKKDPTVQYVEPNYIYTASQADPRLGKLWGLLPGGGGANATGAWASGFTSCNNVVIAIIDQGVQVDHPDLAAAMWTNPGEVAGDGIDNDGSGYVDDINGFDFASKDGSVFDGEGDYHGTHVAGTIGAVGNNGQGVSGVCQSGLKMISAKFLGADGSGTTARAVRALRYLRDLKKRYNLNLVATSNSWGGPYSKALFKAIKAHSKSGILCVAAAGNEEADNDLVPLYPASYDLPNIISVGSVNSSGEISWFSNVGASSVDVFAPGGSILSTWPGNTYKSISGTSMATPHVTGAIALYAAAHKQLKGSWPSAAKTKAAVMDTGVYDAAYDGKCVSKKRLNVGQMIDSITNPTGPSPPPPPRSPPTPEPKKNPKRKMRAIIKLYDNNFDSTNRWWYAWAKVQAIDAETDQPIAGAVFNGTWSITPDNDWSNDYLAEFPYGVVIDTASYTAGWTDSEWMPTAAAASAWWPETYTPDYAAAKVSFSLSAAEHPDYEWDRAASRRSSRQAVRMVSG
ncbi:hypothetical protein OEZ86_006254 [Tetradesmus obliquus]|nr:hypothetical protein OEZ86_006254 [Tetradesmus obliquus]